MYSFLPNAAVNVYYHPIKKTILNNGKCRLPKFKTKVTISKSIFRLNRDSAMILYLLISYGKLLVQFSVGRWLNGWKQCIRSVWFGFRSCSEIQLSAFISHSLVNNVDMLQLTGLSYHCGLYTSIGWRLGWYYTTATPNEISRQNRKAPLSPNVSEFSRRLESIFTRFVQVTSQKPFSIMVHFVAEWRSHVCHFSTR